MLNERHKHMEVHILRDFVQIPPYMNDVKVWFDVVKDGEIVTRTYATSPHLSPAFKAAGVEEGSLVYVCNDAPLQIGPTKAFINRLRKKPYETRSLVPFPDDPLCLILDIEASVAVEISEGAEEPPAGDSET